MEKISQKVSSSSHKSPIPPLSIPSPSLITVLEGAVAAVRGTESIPSLRCLQPGWHSPNQRVSHMQTKPPTPPSHTSQDQGGQEPMQMQPEPFPSTCPPMTGRSITAHRALVPTGTVLHLSCSLEAKLLGSGKCPVPEPKATPFILKHHTHTGVPIGDHRE